MKMSEHLPVPIEVTEIIAKDIGLKTKRYFIQTMIKQIIDRYILKICDLGEILLKKFKICLVLEEFYDFDDLVDGVY